MCIRDRVVERLNLLADAVVLVSAGVGLHLFRRGEILDELLFQAFDVFFGHRFVFRCLACLCIAAKLTRSRFGLTVVATESRFAP